MNDEILKRLVDDGLADPHDTTMTPFGGGVSSDVWRVDTAGRTFVVKRSVPKLRVKADWFSDPARLRYEFLYLQTVGKIVPDAVPALLSRDPEAPYIAMEYLGDGFTNWKTRLLEGDAREEDASRAGGILAKIHAATRGDLDVASRFNTLEFFTQLRIDAYLRATAAKQTPALAGAIEAEADRLSGHHEGLVHGDYSPKNMLVSGDRFVVLDCETACFGDPAFDLAFLLNHLCLKGLSHAPHTPGLDRLATAAIRAYRQTDPEEAVEVEERTARLLPMLLLARADGKSPVEYLSEEKQNFVRRFVPDWICGDGASLRELLAAWFEALPKFQPSNACNQ